MAKSKDTYVEYDLEFLEKKAEEMRRYIDAHPYDKLEDRVRFRETKNGGAIPMVVSTIEQQIASINKMLIDYSIMVRNIADLRQKDEEKKMTSRGDQDVSPFEQGKI